jgi:hypothetical protein
MIMLVSIFLQVMEGAEGPPSSFVQDRLDLRGLDGISTEGLSTEHVACSVPLGHALRQRPVRTRDAQRGLDMST